MGTTVVAFDMSDKPFPNQNGLWHPELKVTMNGTHHKVLDSERRERTEQLKAILRRFNPELTDEHLHDLTRKILQRSLTDD
ncbi:hypothetical protein [Mycobacterium sp. Marseille-P9652]|uniref:hypothetical protein n=1 Tax=Mycobacterium sp. Marseille-P9652 TaxID=2654950 RepID=UPI0012E8903D|nr:hypothetical protein [Mycobacterium sp. Marseille-P9652]